MEHPFMILVWLGEQFGLQHNAFVLKNVFYSWLVMGIMIVLGFLATRSVAMVPGKAQNVFEALIDGVESFMVDVTGEEGRWFFPLAMTIFMYIFLCNLIGLVPTMFPPTADINTPLSCALVVFIFTHFLGIKYHGIKYVKHFTGPIWWMIPIIMPIELIGHAARILSLTFRLFGNMSGHELVLGILFMLAGLYLAPLPIMALGIFVALVQAFVFFLLSIMYFTGSVEHAH